MGAADAYVKSIWKQKRWIAMTPPGVPLALGDVIAVRHGVTQHMTTLQNLGIPFQVALDSSEDSWTCQSTSGIKIDAKLDGSVPKGLRLNVLSLTDVGAVVRTASENAFVMSLGKVRFDHISDVAALGPRILRLFFRNRWDTSWLIVTELASAKRGTFLSSYSKRSQFELKAGAKVSVGPAIDIADLLAGFKLVSSAESNEVFVAKTGVTPLFRAQRWGLIGGTGPAGPRRYLSTEEQRSAEPRLEEFDPTA